MPPRSPKPDTADFAQALGLLVRRIRAAGNDGLSWTDTAVMRRLDKEGATSTATLAREAGMRPQSMGTVVAALESRGLVERRPHPTDGRQQVIALTARGATVRKSSGDAKRSWLNQAMAQLDKEDQKTLLAASALMRRLAQ